MRKYYVGLDVHKLSIAIAVLDAENHGYRKVCRQPRRP